MLRMDQHIAWLAYCFLLSCLFAAVPTRMASQCEQAAQPGNKAPELVILDSDIGDDIDDAFALALALRSPELKVLGISADFGDTAMRARLVDRFLQATGCTVIPVVVGKQTADAVHFTQMEYALQQKEESHPSSTGFILDQIRKYPGQITLIAVGPLVNVGALIDEDPATFKKLKRVVMMGGSIKRRGGDLYYLPATGAAPEYNIRRDVTGAKRLFASGVPIYMMPLDSTQIKLEEVERGILFASGNPLADQLALLYHQWGQLTPTLYDAVAVAYSIKPELCPVQPMHIRVDDDGYTRNESGPANAFVCLHSDSDSFFSLLMPRLLGKEK